MDARRFDSLTKMLARWSSRRKLLGGLAGATAGSLLVRSGDAAAQSPEVTDACGGAVSLDALDGIREVSKATLDNLPDPSKFDASNNSHLHRPQFPEFYDHIKCILTQGLNAPTDFSKPEQLGNFLNQTRGLISTFSVGFAGSYFSDEPFDESTPTSLEPDGVRALLAITPSQVCHGAGCTADALNHALSCYKTCHDAATCYSDCFIAFVHEYVGTKDAPGCMKVIRDACDGDCCGLCVP